MKTITTRLCILFLFLSLTSSAQDFMGFSMSNFSGITGAYLNPASTADSRAIVDIELGGVDFNLSNNYLNLNKEPLRHPLNFLDSNFQKQFLREPINGNTKNMFLGVSVHGPSFMIRLNPKNSIGFTSRVRTYVNMDGLEPALARQLYKGLKDTADAFQVLDNKKLNIEAMSWAEYGITYSHVFMDKGKHFLKAGATVKLLQGLGATYLTISDLHYHVTGKDTNAYVSAKASLGASSNMSLFPFKYTYPGMSILGLGGDIGAIYEYRPDYEKFKYDMDGQTNLDMRWMNKYKFKVGLSVLDIGRIKYNSSTDSRSYAGDINIWTVAKAQPKNVAALDSMMTAKTAALRTPVSNTFSMSLPTTISLQADYQIYRICYVGLIANYAFQFKGATNAIHELSRVAIVPR